jgi:hypothetical protein
MAIAGWFRLARLVAIAACVTLPGVAAAARSSVADADLALGIAGPGSAEMSAWSELRVDVQNLNAGSVRVHLTVTLPSAATRPGAATGASCLGASPPPTPAVVACDLPLDSGVTASVAFPVQWNGPGMRTADARAQVVEPSSTAPDVTATSSVSVYTLVLRHLKTAPSPARKGRTFIATATLARSDTLQPLNAHSVRCLAGTTTVPRGRVLTKLRGRGSHRDAHLSCSWPVPGTAKGGFIVALMLADTHNGGMQTKYPFARIVR